MTETALLTLEINEESVHAFDAEGSSKARSTYSSCSCINPPCPISANR